MKLFNYKLQSLKNSDWIKFIKEQGWKPYLVGGCVRDFLTNVEAKDIDIIVVGCEKEELIDLLKKYGKTDLVGESFAVIKFHHKGEVYDISTPRTEKKTNKGHKGFDIITNKNITLEEDLIRRDITINSVAMDFDGNFVDPFKGIDDIKNKIIRITNPDAFIEDPLRILRCCRFSARFGFTIEERTAKLIFKIKTHIKELSQERIWEELVKSWDQVKDYTEYLGLLSEYDMWDQIFPGSNINEDFAKSSNFIITIASLFKNENPTGLRNRMVDIYKIPDTISTKVEFLITLLNLTPDNVTEMYKKKMQCGIDNKTILEWYRVNKIHDNIFDKFIEYRPSVSAEELMKKGFKGKSLGDEIKRMEIEKFEQMI